VTWNPIDLRQLGDRPNVTVGLSGLGYPGRRHRWQGPPESAKTTVAYIVLLEEARQGRPVLVVDFEMGPHDARDRFRDLGATDSDLERVLFVEPETPASENTLDELVQEWQPTVVLFDSSAGAFDLHGLDDNKRADTERLARLLVDPLRDRDVASIVLDHVVKAQEQRGKWAIGSERKLGGVDVALSFDAKVPLSRGHTGLVRITVAKDRLGHLRRRPHLAELELRSDPDTHRITWAFKADNAPEGGDWRPTRLMEKVSRFLETTSSRPGDEVSRAEVERNVHGRGEFVRQAVDALIHDGYVAETAGPRRSRLIRSVRPFRADDLVPPRPDLVPDEVTYLSRDLVPRPPSLEGDAVADGDGDALAEYEAEVARLTAAAAAGHITDLEWKRGCRAAELLHRTGA
jgi:hypothetical protein